MQLCLSPTGRVLTSSPAKLLCPSDSLHIASVHLRVCPASHTSQAIGHRQTISRPSHHMKEQVPPPVVSRIHSGMPWLASKVFVHNVSVLTSLPASWVQAGPVTKTLCLPDILRIPICTPARACPPLAGRSTCHAVSVCSDHRPHTWVQAALLPSSCADLTFSMSPGWTSGCP